MTGFPGLRADAAYIAVVVSVGIDLIKRFGALGFSGGKCVGSFLLRLGVGGLVHFGKSFVLFFEQGILGRELGFVFDMTIGISFQNGDLFIAFFALFQVFTVGPRSKYLMTGIHHAEDDSDQNTD